MPLFAQQLGQLPFQRRDQARGHLVVRAAAALPTVPLGPGAIQLCQRLFDLFGGSHV